MAKGTIDGALHSSIQATSPRISYKGLANTRQKITPTKGVSVMERRKAMASTITKHKSLD